MRQGAFFLVLLAYGLFFRVLPGMAMDWVMSPLPLHLARGLASDTSSTLGGHEGEGLPHARSKQDEQVRRAVQDLYYYPPALLILDKNFHHFHALQVSSAVVPEVKKVDSFVTSEPEKVRSAPISEPVRVLSDPMIPPKRKLSEPVLKKTVQDEGGRLPSPFPVLFSMAGGGLSILSVLYILMGRTSKVSPPRRDLHHDISRLPWSPWPLVGRRALLRQLNACQAHSEVSIVAFVAPAGAGKSTLVEGWLRSIQPHYGGAHKVFAWTFHSPCHVRAESSSGLFFSKALAFFGHEGALPKSEEKRAVCLAELLQQQPFLLILDGVESFQNAVSDSSAQQVGRFSDPGLYRFLRKMHNRGFQKKYKNSLLLVTSRQPLRELAQQPFARQADRARDTRHDGCLSSAGYREILLDGLTEREGVRFLKILGVRKKISQKLSLTVKTLHGHPLGLLLLGRLLLRRGQPWHLSAIEVQNLLAPGVSGEHVQRVLNHYDEKVWPKESPHGVFLRLLGLFDRPMTEADLQILRADAHLAQPLKSMDSVAFVTMLGELERAGLLLSSAQNRCWQTHALVSAYFHQKLEEEEGRGDATLHTKQTDPPPVTPAAEVPQTGHRLRQAHQVLFDYFYVMAEKNQPDTLEGLEPLYRAVQHGCRAENYKDALYSVYVQRIHRGSEYFSLANLGAYGSDVTALVCFFPQGWRAPPVEADLSLGDQAWLLAEATFCLSALGRVPEALLPQEEGVRIEIQRGAWQGVPRAAATLSDLQVATGKLMQALASVEQGKQWAERHAILPLQGLMQTKRAVVLHRLGEYSQSLLAFQAAEAIQAELTPEQPRLQAMPGKAYADLLLEQKLASFENILQRVGESWQRATQEENRPLVALSLLTQARVFAAMDRADKAYEPFDTAVSILENGENAPILAEILLHRATFMRQQREQDMARQDLEEGLDIAQRCGLALLEVDGKLLKSQVLLDDNRREEAEELLTSAERAITQMEYGQRRAAAQALRSRWF